MDGVEWIQEGGQTIAVIIRAQVSPERTTFVTPDSFTQQAGFVVYPAGGTIATHSHRPISRAITGTSEMLLVRSGRAQVLLYNDARQLVAERELVTGDVLLLVSGGHGFKIIEDTVLFEVKQGPYTGIDEKERFA
jgi:hypothetical protein